MKSFKQYLLEYLNPDQLAQYSSIKMHPEARARTDHYFGKNNDMKREDVHYEQTEKSPVHQDVEKHFGQEISIPDYNAGYLRDAKNRQIRIGSRLSEHPDLLKNFTKDPTRSSSKLNTEGMYATIHRGTQVAGQTNPDPNELHPYGHSWACQGGSCKNITDEQAGTKYLKGEIKHGSVVMFGHNKEGKEIYRATLQPHYNPTNTHTIYDVNAEYGEPHPAFKKKAREVAAKLSTPGAPTGEMYSISPEVYNNRHHNEAFGIHPDMMLHPHATAKEVEHLYNTAEDSIYPDTQPILAASHPNFPKEKLIPLLQKGEYRTANILKIRPDITAEDLSHVTKHNDDINMQITALKHPQANSSHIQDILDKTSHPRVEFKAITHPASTQAHWSQVINDPRRDPDVQAAAIRRTKNPDDLKLALKIGQPSQKRGAALMNPAFKDTDEMSHIVSNPIEHPYIRGAVLLNPHATDEHVKQAFQHEPDYHKRGDIANFALFNKNIKPSTLVDMVNNHLSGTSVNKLDAGHFPNLSSEHVGALIQHAKDPFLRGRFLNHKAATPEHLKHATNDINSFVGAVARYLLGGGERQANGNPKDFEQHLPWWARPTNKGWMV